jgi:hypothetical protein
VISPGDEAGLRYWHEAELFRRAQIGKILPSGILFRARRAGKALMADVSPSAGHDERSFTRCAKKRVLLRHTTRSFQEAPVRRRLCSC